MLNNPKEKSGDFNSSSTAVKSLEFETNLTEHTLKIDKKENGFDSIKSYYGMTPEQYCEGIKFHNEYFDQLKNLNYSL